MLQPKVWIVDSNDRRLAADIQADRLVVIIFYDVQCPHSMRFLKAVREASARFSEPVKVVRCKIADGLRSAAYNKISSTPTALIIRNGVVIGKSEGELNSAEILLFINSHLRGAKQS